MKKNLVILALFCVIAVLGASLWFKEDLKEPPAKVAPVSAKTQIATPAGPVAPSATKQPSAQSAEGILIETSVNVSINEEVGK